jgi:hypothetical protein
MGSTLIGSFQTRVNLDNPYGVAGDFASANPRATALTPTGGALIAGASGVAIGKFAWVASDGRTVNSYASGPVKPTGFVHRDQQGLLTQYLQAAGNLIPPGFPVTLMVEGDFFATDLGPSSMTAGSAIYAGYADGGIYTAAPAGASFTAALGSTNTASLGATFTAAASSASNQLVVTAVTGLISIGDTVSGSGITNAPTIIAQVSGTTGGAGTYTLSNTETCTGGTVTCFGTVVDVTVVSNYISVGDTIAHASYPSGAKITGQTSGTTGGVGVYTISAPGTAYVASTAAVTTFGITVTVTAVGSGTLAVGDPVTDTTTAANVATGAVIASQVSGTPGSTGVYTLNLSSAGGGGVYAAGDALTTTGGIQTSFYAKTACNVGELVQKSTWGN